MTAGDEYLPVPTISRDENVLSAIVTRSTANALSPTEPSALLDPAADEVDDLDFVSVTHHRHVERVTLEHDQVVLHRDTAPVDLEARQQLVHRQGAGDLVRVAVQGNLQFPKPILAARGGNPPAFGAPSAAAALGTPFGTPSAGAALGTPVGRRCIPPPPQRGGHQMPVSEQPAVEGGRRTEGG